MKSQQRSNVNKAPLPIIACNLQHWTLNENQCQVPDDNLSARSYHDKDVKKQETGSNNLLRSQYFQVKQNYIVSRGGTWALQNKRPDHLRDSVREMEEILKSHSVLFIKWTKRNRIQILLHTGTILNILMTESYDVLKLAVDKSITNKIPSDSGPICSGVLTERFCLLSFADKNKLGFVSYTQRPSTPEHKQVTSKISSMDMKISFHEIPGSPSGKCERKLCVNKVEDMAICWCSTYKAPTTWTPTFSEQDRANLILLSCSFGRMEVCSYVQTECDPVSVEFSRLNPYQVHTLEKSINTRNEPQLHYTVYECTQSRIQRLSVSAIPLKYGVLACARNRDEDKIVIGCTDGTLILYNIFTKTASTVRSLLVPSIVSWHPNGGIVMVASGNAELRCYDSSLHPLLTALIGDVLSDKKKDTLKLSQFLPSGNGLVNLKWPVLMDGDDSNDHLGLRSKKQHACYETALLLFDGGPLTILQLQLGVKTRGLLRPIEIIKQYLICDNVRPAIQVLYTINWNLDKVQAFLGLVSILNHLLKQTLTLEREENLEATLSAFYAPKCPLAESVVVEYRHAVSRYARRFYHHLLRFKRFEKAFLLAKDIQDPDLFVDLYFYAQEAGKLQIARAAKQKALELQSSDTSDEEDSYSGGESEEEPRRRGKEEDTRIKSHAVKESYHPPRKSKEQFVRKLNKKKEIPPDYPRPKADDFMRSLMNEVQSVIEDDTTSPQNQEEASASVSAPNNSSGSTLQVMHFGYV